MRSGCKGTRYPPVTECRVKRSRVPSTRNLYPPASRSPLRPLNPAVSLAIDPTPAALVGGVHPGRISGRAVFDKYSSVFPRCGLSLAYLLRALGAIMSRHPKPYGSPREPCSRQLLIDALESHRTVELRQGSMPLRRIGGEIGPPAGELSPNPHHLSTFRPGSRLRLAREPNGALVRLFPWHADDSPPSPDRRPVQYQVWTFPGTSEFETTNRLQTAMPTSSSSDRTRETFVTRTPLPCNPALVCCDTGRRVGPVVSTGRDQAGAATARPPIGIAVPPWRCSLAPRLASTT